MYPTCRIFEIYRICQIKDLTEPSAAFIEDVTRLMVPWGVPQTAARLYGYLLLSAEPVSLDRITSDLEISKSSASVARGCLEQYTLARRHGERGSKRALYGVSDNYEGMLTEQNRLLDALAVLLRTGATTSHRKRHAIVSKKWPSSIWRYAKRWSQRFSAGARRERRAQSAKPAPGMTLRKR